MKKSLLLLIVFLVCMLFMTNAQFSIIGQLKDTAVEKMDPAMVMLLNPKDSTLINYTMSDAAGKFAFRNIRKMNYVLKISHMTYMPVQMNIVPKENEKEQNLGTIEVKPIANFLMEVVVKAARAPIFIKGDTVEYDATTFKVPPGSTVEDLLKRLPGVEVDVNGNITTMGKDVKTVYVDGKAFFGSDPKTVTQNLDAAAVKKVQVFNEQSEQEKITGIKDGSKDQVMNLELKPEYKKGYFGKATVGYGWGENALHRWVAKGSFNWFNDKQQLSFIGYGNNINESSFNWSDYSEFYGQSMQTGNDDGTFGFNSGNGRRYFSFRNYGGDGSGFSQNAGGGINYNYYTKKLKFNAGCFYTRNYTYNSQYANRQTFLQDSTYWNIDTSNNDNTRNNINFATRFEYDIDSVNNLVLRANVDFTNTNRTNLSEELFQTSDFQNINLNSLKNINKDYGLNLNTLAIYTHKFKKKGRRFAMSGSYIFSRGQTLEDINNLNKFFSLSPNEQIKLIVKNDENSIEHTEKASLLYVEPIGKGKMFTLQGFYNFSTSNKTNANDSRDEARQSIDSLWMIYQNTEFYNRLGTSLHFHKDGINMLAGVAYQNLNIKAHNELTNSIIDFKTRSYDNVIPYVEANFELPRNFSINLNYSYDVEEPSINYLFPMPSLNINNKTLGNPNLEPEHSHDVEMGLWYWNQAKMSNISLRAEAQFYTNQIVYNQTTEMVEGIGYVTSSIPENLKGGHSYSTYLWSNFPIVKTILTMNISANGSISDNPAYINGIKNITNTKYAGGSIGLNITAGEKLSFNAGGSAYATYTKYSIQKDRNQNYMNYSARAGFKWQVFKKTFLEGNYGFSYYDNKKMDFYQNIHTLNVAIRQVIGKKNQFEIRLACIDLLNQNQYIRQMTSVNYVEYRISPTLARYFLVTFAYNLRGFDLESKNRMFF